MYTFRPTRETISIMLCIIATLLSLISPAVSQNAKAAPSANTGGYTVAHVLDRSAGYVNAMACTPDGSLLGVASDSGRVTLWSTASGRMVREFRGHEGPVYSVAISYDGSTIATAGYDETIRIWQLSSGRELRTLTGHKGWINAVAFTSDGHKLFSAGRDRTLRTWDVDTGKLLRMVEHPSEVFTVAASPGMPWFASDKENSFSIREIETGKEVSSGAPGQWGINTIIFNSGRAQLMTGGYDGVLWVWNIREVKVEQHIKVEGSPIISLATTAKGSLLAALCSGNGTVVLFDTAAWKETLRLPGVTYPVGSVVLCADGHILAAGGGDSPIRIWKRNSAR
jgi:WD40 repeat protein